MTISRTVDNYGGVFSDAFPVEDPTVEQSATYANVLHEDTAEMTRTTVKVRVRFPTSTGGAGAITPSSGTSHMGTGSGQLPTVAKTATGRYTVTYPTSFLNGLGTTENIGFSYSAGRVVHLTTAGTVQTTEATNVISVAVFDMAGAASDLGGSITIEVEAS